MTSYDYSDLKSEFNLFSGDGDPWGDVMHWWFTIADEIYFSRDFDVPKEWRFRPSPLGPTNDPEDYAAHVIAQASDAALQRFGAVMHRYAQKLKHAGKDY